MSLVRFHPDPYRLLLFSLSLDKSCKIFDLNDQTCSASFSNHVSPPTDFALSDDGYLMATAGRDKVIYIYINICMSICVYVCLYVCMYLFGLILSCLSVSYIFFYCFSFWRFIGCCCCCCCCCCFLHMIMILLNM